MIVSYAHLSYAIKKEGKGNKKNFVINTATKLLKLQMQLGDSNDLKAFAQRLSDKFALGYMFGFNDALLQLSSIDDQAESLAIMTIVYSNLLDGDVEAATSILKQSLKFQKEDAFREGMMAGGNDLNEFFSDKTPPLGLAKFLQGEEE